MTVAAEKAHKMLELEATVRKLQGEVKRAAAAYRGEQPARGKCIVTNEELGTVEFELHNASVHLFSAASVLELIVDEGLEEVWEAGV